MVRKKLPTELGLEVIDALGDELDISVDAYYAYESSLWDLRSCSLVCRDWLNRSRIHLFRAVYIRDREGLESLRFALKHHPELLGCVEALHIHSEEEVNITITSLLPRLPKLHVLGLWGNEGRDDEPKLNDLARKALGHSENITALYTNYKMFMAEASFLRLVAAFRSLSKIFLDGDLLAFPKDSPKLGRRLYKNIIGRKLPVRSIKMDTVSEMRLPRFL